MTKKSRRGRERGRCRGRREGEEEEELVVVVVEKVGDEKERANIMIMLVAYKEGSTLSP